MFYCANNIDIDNPLSANSNGQNGQTKWSNTFKQFVGNSRPIV